MHISLLSKKYDQSVCENLRQYSIDAFVMFKNVTNIFVLVVLVWTLKILSEPSFRYRGIALNY